MVIAVIKIVEAGVYAPVGLAASSSWSLLRPGFHALQFIGDVLVVLFSVISDR